MYGNMWRQLPPVTKNLLIINVLIWIVTELAGARGAYNIERYCGLHYFESPLFNPIQLFTYMFMHAGFTHLFFNMFALFMFGGWLERTMGSKRFLSYYLICGVGAALIQEASYAVMLGKYADFMSPEMIREVKAHGATALRNGLNYSNPSMGAYNLMLNNATVGASGAIYGILLAFGMLFPNMPMYLMFVPVPIKAKWMVIGYAALELMLGLKNNAGDNVAHFAHLGGMLVGIIIILYWRRRGILRRYY